MCIIGNPPYSAMSINQGKWINSLIEDYKYIAGNHFGEKKHWLNDDYVKFIRYGQYYIEKNKQGILAFINPHGFLSNPTFRGMRWNLLKTFDKIYAIDLHGNSNRLEKAPNGSPDVNVFDIQQGVSINIFIKTGKKQPDDLGTVFTSDMYGQRDYKYNKLFNNKLAEIPFKKLNPKGPYYFFVEIDDELWASYNDFLSITQLFNLNTVGFVSANDGLNISFTQEEQREKINDILSMDEASWRIKYKRPNDAQSWKYEWAKEDARKNKAIDLNKVSYRPFDTRWTLYTGNSGGLYARPVDQAMRHFLEGDNLGLITARSNKSDTCDHFFISKYIVETKCGERTTQSAIFPIYIYHTENGQKVVEPIPSRQPNFNGEIINEIAEKLKISFTPEKDTSKELFSPIDLLDYIYAVLYSVSYREKYKKFLKTDFPKIPYPENKDLFWQLVQLGADLRTIHLLENPVVDEYITSYPVDGNNIVEKPVYTEKKVFINKEQYFANVPEIAWTFYIGGYQPAQKWLKDRKGRELSYDDILHYQRLIVALVETDRIMKEIDHIIEL